MSRTNRNLCSKILLVEDDKLQALWICRILEEFGYTVQWVADGAQAVKILENNSFQIVMTDLMMPFMNGIELCRAIREQTYDHYIYIVIVTGKEEKSDLIAGIEAGADDYMVKPIDKNEMFARLKTAERILNMERTLRKQYAEIVHLSETDPLTGLYNRRYFTEHLPGEMLRSARYSHDLSLILCDIDRFKRVNDTYGHLVGDQMLQKFAACLTTGVRQGIDYVVRFGGEEFMIVLPVTGRGRVKACSERLRLEVSRLCVSTESGLIGLTASFGAVTVLGKRQRAYPSMDVLLKTADDNLYKAKNQGRNRCVFSEI